MIIIKKDQTLYDVVSSHPDVTNIMLELGFEDIIKPGMLNTMGRFMTIEKGANAKHIKWETIEKAFKDNGYIIK